MPGQVRALGSPTALLDLTKRKISNNKIICPEVVVRYWNSNSVWVQCPYCEEIHRHGKQTYNQRDSQLPDNLHCRSGQRVPHCSSTMPNSEYRLTFPIDEHAGLIGYEVDKTRALFVNVEARLDGEGENSYTSDKDVHSLAEMFGTALSTSSTSRKLAQGNSFWDDSKEVEAIPFSKGRTFEQKIILRALSDCVTGKLPEVQRYLGTSTETELFLHGRHHTGDTILIKAASEESHEMVSLLLKHSVDVNATNNQGRSALMNAALWGRLKNVEHLLKAGADQNLRDLEGRRAVDLAQATLKNENERYRMGDFAAEYKIRERDKERRYIVILLSDGIPKKQHGYSAPLSENEQKKYLFKKSSLEMSITLHGPVLNHGVSDIQKTLAVLDRGKPFARKEAISGWGKAALPTNEVGVQEWVEQVRYIASVIGHALPNSYKDQGKPGRYSTSHSEKKLIAYFIDKHVFLPRDKESDLELSTRILNSECRLEEDKDLFRVQRTVCDLEITKKQLENKLWNAKDRKRYDNDNYNEEEVARLERKILAIEKELSDLQSDPMVVKMREKEREIQQLLEEERVHEELMGLCENEPHITLKHAVILSSNGICTDCNTFKDKVNKYFGLNIQIRYRG